MNVLVRIVHFSGRFSLAYNDKHETLYDVDNWHFLLGKVPHKMSYVAAFRIFLIYNPSNISPAHDWSKRVT